MPKKPKNTDDEYRKKMQTRILTIIKDKLDKEEMTADRAKEISQYVLSCFGKGDSKMKIFLAVKNFDLKKYPELLNITVLAIKEKIEDKFQKIAVKLGFLLKNKRLDEAEKLLKNLK